MKTVQLFLLLVFIILCAFAMFFNQETKIMQNQDRYEAEEQKAINMAWMQTVSYAAKNPDNINFLKMSKVSFANVGGIDFSGMSASSALVKSIVTTDRVDLMKSMKQNRQFVMSLASQMREEFKGYELSEYEDNVRVTLRFVETAARDGKNLDKSLSILNQIANDSASSAVGSSFYVGCISLKGKGELKKVHRN